MSVQATIERPESVERTAPAAIRSTVGLERLGEPYYKDEYVTLYHGNSAAIVPLLGRFDLLLTDPKYGIGADRAAADAAKQRIAAAGKTKAGRGWKYYGDSEWDDERTPRWLLEMALDKCDEAIVWGGNYFTDALPPRMGWLVWNKMQRDFSLADGELAWTSYQKAMRICDISRGKALTDGKEHPTQKSLDLMKWCVDYADRAGGKRIETILDPFAGSGTTGRAAKDLNRRCVLVEQNEQYCEIIARRMAQAVLAL